MRNPAHATHPAPSASGPLALFSRSFRLRLAPLVSSVITAVDPAAGAEGLPPSRRSSADPLLAPSNRQPSTRSNCRACCAEAPRSRMPRQPHCRDALLLADVGGQHHEPGPPPPERKRPASQDPPAHSLHVIPRPVTQSRATRLMSGPPHIASLAPPQSWIGATAPTSLRTSATQIWLIWIGVPRPQLPREGRSRRAPILWRPGSLAGIATRSSPHHRPARLQAVAGEAGTAPCCTRAGTPCSGICGQAACLSGGACLARLWVWELPPRPTCG